MLESSAISRFQLRYPIVFDSMGPAGKISESEVDVKVVEWYDRAAILPSEQALLGIMSSIRKETRALWNDPRIFHNEISDRNIAERKSECAGKLTAPGIIDWIRKRIEQNQCLTNICLSTKTLTVQSVLRTSTTK